MFADTFTIKLGETTVKGKRLTIREIRENRIADASGGLSVEQAIKLIKSHATLENGDAVDPEDLTPGQLKKLIGEIVLPEEGRGISDFIGLLS